MLAPVRQPPGCRLVPTILTMHWEHTCIGLFFSWVLLLLISLISAEVLITGDKKCLVNHRILLANPKVPTLVHPTRLLGRQNSVGNLRKTRYCENLERDAPTVPHEPRLSTASGNSGAISSSVSLRFVRLP